MCSTDYPHTEPTKPLLSKPARRSLNRSMRIRWNQFRFQNSTNAPYLSGDSIASLTNYYVYGKHGNEPLQLDKLRKARSIFINSHKLEDFLEESSGVDLNDVTLVTGNSDFNFIDAKALPNGIRLWLCQNNAMPEKGNLLTLPIGIENLRLGRLGLPKWYNRVGQNKIMQKILVPPMAPTNPSRYVAVEQAKANPKLFDVYKDYLIEREYFNLTREYKFILCCEGNGFENHRIWETLYQNSFPVMVRSPWSNSLRYLNLPILFVDSLDEISAEILANFASLNTEFRAKDCAQLWTPFWDNLINDQSFDVKLD
jgi:hypothetical protein